MLSTSSSSMSPTANVSAVIYVLPPLSMSPSSDQHLGSPLCGSFPGPGQAAGRLHPEGYVLSPKAQYPLRDMDEQFASGWRRTRKHDN
ncbi:hypothetical protein F2Q69_00054436 [Brassica cretica]|uniref:Uncharacterized protein n=1 Tax=Brassica cretica TaxID=69181 RepID=A0A8S9MVJ7_BRACR|nr:hypothetical protein F2Q69_00054436 [Brassica cretica]